MLFGYEQHRMIILSIAIMTIGVVFIIIMKNIVLLQVKQWEYYSKKCYMRVILFQEGICFYIKNYIIRDLNFRFSLEYIK